MRRVRAGIATLTRSAAVDAYALKPAVGHATGKQPAKSNWVHLSLARAGITSAECLSSTMVDVLEVEEDDDASRPHGGQRSDPV